MVIDKVLHTITKLDRFRYRCIWGTESIGIGVSELAEHAIDLVEDEKH